MYRYKLLLVSKGYEGSIFARVGGIYDRRYASNKPQLNFSGFNTREYRGNDSRRFDRLFVTLSTLSVQ